MKCGKCGATSIREERLTIDQDGTVTVLKCLICGNSSDSKRWGFTGDEEMSVKQVGKCKNCERDNMALNMGLCSSCSNAWYRDGDEGLSKAKEKFFGKPKAFARQPNEKVKEAAKVVNDAMEAHEKFPAFRGAETTEILANLLSKADEPAKPPVNILSASNLIAAIEGLYREKESVISQHKATVLELLREDFGSLKA